MQLTKTKFYFLLQALFIGGILLMQLFWLFSRTTEAQILEIGRMADSGNFKIVESMTVRYRVDLKTYVKTFTRNETSKSARSVNIRYSIFFPELSRLDSFEGNWLGTLVSYLIFFLGTSMIFFIPNDLLPRGTEIVLTKKYPCIRFVKLSQSQNKCDRDT